MGYYTDLVVKAIIKEEYRDKIAKRITGKFGWSELFDDPFSMMGLAANTIPFQENELTRKELFDGKTMQINCSVKNYDGRIEAFFEFLQAISDEIIEFKTHGEGDYTDYCDTNDEKTYDIWYNFLTNKREYIEEDKEI